MSLTKVAKTEISDPRTLRGIISYPITPFRDGAIDVDAVERTVERLVVGEAHAIACLGSTGESAYLNLSEWEEVAQSTVGVVNKRCPVIVGVSELTTEGALRKAKTAERVGADAVMLLVTAYWKLSDSEIRRHISKVAGSLSIPVMLYNNPATSGVDLAPELMVELWREVDQITMIKESTGDIRRMHRIRQLSEGKLPFYNGCNPLALEAFAAGAAGWCTAAHNLIPKQTLALYEAVQENRLDQARQVFYEQLDFLTFILQRGLPATIKAGLRILGCEAGDPRLPLQPLNDEENRRLEKLLRELGVHGV